MSDFCTATLVNTIINNEVFWSSLYYFHFIPMGAIIILTVFAFRNSPSSKFALTILISAFVTGIWLILNLYSYIAPTENAASFVYSIQVHFVLLLFTTAFFSAYVYIYDLWPPGHYSSIALIMFIPLLLFSHTNLNIREVTIDYCGFNYELGLLGNWYIFSVQAVILISILILLIKKLSESNNKQNRQNIILFTLSLLLLLLAVLYQTISDSSLRFLLLGLIPLSFIGYIYVHVDFNAKKTKVIATEAILFAITILLFSLYFVPRLEDALIIVSLALILLLFLSILFIKSVRFEVRQQSEIEKLLGGLARANRHLQTMDKQKSEFVSIASHQLRSPLTAIRGYASMLTDGSYGQIPLKAKQPLEIIAESARLMALSIEDYLNVSRIEAGNMKFDFADFSLPEEIEKIVDGMRAEAIQQGLLLMYRSKLESKGVVFADRGKVSQIIYNLLNNSIKYTPKGSITVFVHDSLAEKKIYVEIIDTGIGMSPETIDSLFQKFKRAANANTVNVQGTGLGLYVAKRMATHMQGDVSAYSDGEGKGSRFIFEIPLKF